MQAQAAQPSKLAKALRVALTFLLVFGLSFQTEIALAVKYKAGEDLDSYVEAEDEIESLAVYKVIGSDLGAAPIRAVSSAGADPKDEPEAAVDDDGTIKVAAVPTWKVAGDGKDPKVLADDSIVKWSVGGSEAQAKDGVLAIELEEGDSKAVVCELTDEAKAAFPDAKNFKVSFTVTRDQAEPPEPEPEPEPEPYAAEVSISCDKIQSGTVERLKGDDFDEAGYQFSAAVKVFAAPDEEGGDADGELLYDSATATEDLATWSKGEIVPKWEVKFTGDQPADPDAVASIDENGLLKVFQDCDLQVWYTVNPPAGETADSLNVKFTTSGKAKEYDQGANKPQESIAFSGYFFPDDLGGEEFGGEEDESAEGESGDKPAKLYRDDYTNVADFADPFKADDVAKLSSYGQATYQMVSGKEKEVGITGKGAALTELLDSMFEGISDSSAIEQIQFKDCDGGMVTYNWADLKALNPVIATDSVVHLPESLMDPSDSPDGEGSESQADASEPVDIDKLLEEYGPYTRFRLLYDDPSGSVGDVNGVAVDADRLRSIKEVVINPQIDPEDRREADYNVTLLYTPVPVGKIATFDAQTTGPLSEANFTWEESSDGGKTWKTLKETSAQYQVKTTKENLGHIIKATATAVDSPDIRDSDQKEIAEPEKNDEIIFALSYRPPVAGDLAFFQVELVNGEIDLSTLDYIWEYAEGDNKTKDGGWTPLHESYQGKPTLSIQTSKITDTGDSPETPVSIRCRIVQKTGDDGGPWIAGPVDFWVRNEGESSEDDNKEQPNPGGETPDKPSGGIDDPDPTPAPKDPVPDSPDSDYQPINLSNVVIDDEVSEQIVEQEAAEQAEFESTVPGARWTTLSTKDASGNDGRNVFGTNPFAPFAIPVGLGVTAAGGLEKLLTFRRQL